MGLVSLFFESQATLDTLVGKFLANIQMMYVVVTELFHFMPKVYSEFSLQHVRSNRRAPIHPAILGNNRERFWARKGQEKGQRVRKKEEEKRR